MEIEGACESVVRDLGPGRELSQAVRAPFEAHFGADLSNGRIHDGPSASRAAGYVDARAFALDHRIAFRSGEFSTHSASGRRLLAHELTHVVRTPGGEGVLHRDDDPSGGVSDAAPAPADLDAEFRTAVQMGDWPAAAEWLNGFNYADIMSRLALLTPEQVASIHQGARANPRVGEFSQVAQLTANSSQVSDQVATPDTPSPAPAPDPTPSMSATDKLVEAINRGFRQFPASVVEQLEGLLSPEAIATILVIWAASHTEGLGELVDVAAIILEGMQFKQILEDLYDYVTLSLTARTSRDLDAAGKKFADALAAAGVAKLVELLARFAKGKGGGKGHAEGEVSAADETAGKPEPTPEEQPGPTEDTPPDSKPAEEPAADRDPAGRPKVVDETASVDGRRNLEFLEDGECLVCASLYVEIRNKYADELAANPEIAAELDDAARLTDVAAREARFQMIEQRLAETRARSSAPSEATAEEPAAQEGAPDPPRRFSPEARAAFARLGIADSQLEALAGGEPIAFTLAGAAEGTIAVAQLTPAGRFHIGIYTSKNIGGGLADFLNLKSGAQAAARAAGATEVELLGIEITNARLQAILEKRGYTPTTMPVPDELGGGTFHAISMVEPVE